MNKPERALVIILRIIGVSALFAIPFIFVPYEWMNAIHKYLGLGEMPDAPIVSYLARSLSAFYATSGAMVLYVSFDIPRYHNYIRLWAAIIVVMGGVLLGVDLSAGMPTSWVLSEGPPTIATGFVVLWLLAASRRHTEMPARTEASTA